ncbi:MAG TPA: trypsin-like peptidase domain-containing protein [Candidatus Limnocylindrales bacterium]|nr:trypsin-like peptidase domain-containing protein [Candidatus Limnocylindrales bacterium]
MDFFEQRTDAVPLPPSAPVRPHRRRLPRRSLGLAIGASLLSASIASAATAAIALTVVPHPSPAPVADPVSTTTSGGTARTTIDNTAASNAIEAVASEVSPAVVTITSSSAGSRVDPFSIPETGVGSGFIYASDGRILTNNHVVEGAETLTVTLKDGTELPARVLVTDAAHDLAIVKIDRTGLPTVTLGDSASLNVGQLLIAIGSPLGQFTESVTSGILSATGRSIDVRDAGTRAAKHLTDLLQTDAAINPGNSGGPLLDAAGEVIGINTAIASSAEGIGFAIPIDSAKALVAQAASAT